MRGLGVDPVELDIDRPAEIFLRTSDGLHIGPLCNTHKWPPSTLKVNLDPYRASSYDPIFEQHQACHNGYVNSNNSIPSSPDSILYIQPFQDSDPPESYLQLQFY